MADTVAVALPVVRWTGRIVAASLIALVMVFVIGEGCHIPTSLDWRRIPFEACFFTALLGMALGCWKELPGALVSLAGVIGFYTLNYAASGRLPGGWVFPSMFVPGLLFLTAWAMAKAGRQQDPAQP